MTLYATQIGMVTATCCVKGCGIAFGMTRAFYDQAQGNSEVSFYCTNGHGQHYTGPSDAQKLRDAESRETALRDQLEAAIREGEQQRTELMRIRSRIANGVCPCCNRSFDNVRRHITSQHPDFKTSATTWSSKKYRCSCGGRFDTFHGLRIHQGRSRETEGRYRWDRQGQDAWYAHLTEVSA